LEVSPAGKQTVSPWNGKRRGAVNLREVIYRKKKNFGVRFQGLGKQVASSISKKTRGGLIQKRRGVGDENQKSQHNGRRT